MKMPHAMVRMVALAGCLLASGCVTQSSAPVSPHGGSTTSDTDNDARGRARIHTELAASYLEIRNLAVALEEVGIAQRSDPTYSLAYIVAGLIHVELKDDRLAEENFRRAVNISPRDADANNNYGTFLCQRKREADGIKYFMVATNDPLYRAPEVSFVSAGMCARQQGDLANADTYFRTALKHQPNQIQALYQLADLSYTRGNFGEARALLAQLIPVAANSQEILWLMLRTERRLGGGSNMVESLAHQLRTRFPNSSEAQALAAGRYE